MHLVKTAFSAMFKPVTLSRYNKVTNFDYHFIGILLVGFYIKIWDQVSVKMKILTTIFPFFGRARNRSQECISRISDSHEV